MDPLLSRLRGFLDDLPLRPALGLALAAGLAVPLILAALAHFSQQRDALLARQATDHDRITEVLALGMQAPLWELRPEAGQPLIDALMLDERITAIEVNSPLAPDFLSLRLPDRRLGQERTLEKPVLFEGDSIGRVRVTMDTGLLAARVTGQWVEVLIGGLAQFGAGMVIIFALLGYKVLQPLRRLVAQSRALAAGALDRPLAWRRGDELGELGRSFEETRQSLRHLVADLDRRNRELKTREGELETLLHHMDETRQLLEAVMDAVPAMIHVKDRQLRYRIVNHQFLRWWGLERDQVLGRRNDQVLEALRQAGTLPEGRTAEGRGPHRDELPALMESIHERDQQVLDSGRPLPFYETVHGGDTPQATAIWTTKVPLVGGDGQVSHIVTVSIDITARKLAEAELTRHREALHQSEKLSALGGLLAGVAHELNNPLSVVVGRSIMLEEQLRDTPAGRSIQKVRGAAERCARIVRTFLAMARYQDPARVPVPLNRMVAAALELVDYGLNADGIEVEVDLDPDLPQALADPDQVTQVFMNLLINARHALSHTPHPRRITVTAHFDAAAGQLQVAVADNGPGIPPAIRSRIFDPFFTTKPVGEGTGVGLSVCHSIIRAHGGTLEVQSPPGGGTVFLLGLPVEAGADAGPRPRPDPACRTQDCRVLVVDDEPEVARTLADILGNGRHRIELAGNGREALARLEDEDFDLILSDLRMPDLDGPGLYAELKARRPELVERLIFVTGDTLGESARRFLERAHRPVIEKPFVPAEVRRLAARVMDQSRPLAASGPQQLT